MPLLGMSVAIVAVLWRRVGLLQRLWRTSRGGGKHYHCFL